MVVKILAKYDGKVFVPQEPVELPPGAACALTVEQPPADEVPDVLAQLAALATDMGVTDLAERHSEYAHGRKFGGKFPE
jgi:hypothetical protein